MILYFFIFFLLLSGALLEIISNNKKFSQSTFTFFIFCFFILSFIRWETGTDWTPYYDVFKSIEIPWETLTDYLHGFEPGFMILYNIAKSISDSYTIMLLIEAIILYFCIYYFIKAHSFYPILSLLIYYSMSFAGIFFVRQNIAMAILLCSLKYIYEKKIIPFILIVIIAASIHRTAIIFLIAYPFFYKFYKLKSIILVTLLASIIGITLGKLMLTFLGELGLGIISAKVNAYLDAGTDDNATTFSTTGVLIRGLINRAFLIIVYLSILNNERKNNVILNGLINLNILGIILYVILTPIAFSLGRITAYFDILQIFIIPYLFINSSLKTKCNLLFLLSLYLGLRLYTAIAAFPEEYIPYKTFLEY